LLSCNAQLAIDQSSLTNLNLGALSAVAVLGTTLNVTRSTFSGVWTRGAALAHSSGPDGSQRTISLILAF